MMVFRVMVKRETGKRMQAWPMELFCCMIVLTAALLHHSDLRFPTYYTPSYHKITSTPHF